MHDLKQHFAPQVQDWVRVNGAYSESNVLYFMKEVATPVEGGVQVRLRILTTSENNFASLQEELADYVYTPSGVEGVTWPKYVYKPTTEQ